MKKNTALKKENHISRDTKKVTEKSVNNKVNPTNNSKPKVKRFVIIELYKRRVNLTSYIFKDYHLEEKDALFYSLKEGTVFDNTYIEKVSLIIKKMFSYIEKEDSIIPHVIYSVPQGITKSGIVTSLFRNNKDIILDKKKIDYFVNKSLGSLNLNDSHELLVSNLNRVTIDGYRSEDIEEFKGRIFEFATFYNYIPKKYLDYITNLSSLLDKNILTVSPTLYSGLQNISLKDALVLRVNDFTTDIAIFLRGKLYSINTVKFGKQSFSKYLAAYLDMHRKEAQSILDKFKNGEDIKEKDLEYIEDIYLHYLNSIKNTIDHVSHIKGIPLTIHLVNCPKNLEVFIKNNASVMFKDSSIESSKIEVSKVKLDFKKYLSKLAIKLINE